MVEKEAKKVIEIMLTVDGDCYHCAAQLIGKFCLICPEYRQLAVEMYKKEFDKSLVEYALFPIVRESVS